ncbi:MAG: S46 family peptidase [Salinivenus sp.]
MTDRPESTADATPTTSDSAAPLVPVPSEYDTATVRRFDRGKMWLLNELPTEYFEEEYGLVPDEEWRTQVMRASLRFGDNCSASFVSPQGLVMTNHHCAREYVTALPDSGRHYFRDGFYAPSPSQEKRSRSLHVDQLVDIEDVTDQVTDELIESGDQRGQQRRQRVQQLEDELTAEAKEEDERRRVDIVSLYRGAQYAAYTYVRHEDVRLVMVPEQALGFFGGEPDNFTYPRHTLDVAFFRVYNQEGEPLQTNHHFSWEPEGAQAGDAVFAAGNPGSSSRLDMVSQFEYERDHRLPGRLDVLRSRSEIMDTYIEEHPDSAEAYDLQNTYFSIRNTVKSLEGQLRGLRDPYLIARRAQAVRTLQDTLQSIDSLQSVARSVQEIDRLQQSKRAQADREKAFTTMGSVQLGSRVLTRALHGYYYDFLRTRGGNPEQIESIRSDAESIENWPSALERSMIIAQLRDVRRAYGSDHPTVERVLKDRSIPEVATRLVENSALMDSTSFMELLDEGYLRSGDASVRVIQALGPLFLNVNRQMNDLRNSEETLNRRLSEARRAVYGASIPPDATFSLRISDGIVKGYQQSSDSISAFTTFDGLYDKHRSREGSAWDLPERWEPAPDSLALDTPLNLVSTNDISGGSSGSPLLNRDLEVVGVVFDSNMEALPNRFLYRSKQARAISVDVRGIQEALEVVYGAEALVEELTGAAQPEASRSSSR